MEKLYQKLKPEHKKPVPGTQELANIISDLESNDQIGLDIKVKKDNEIKRLKKKTKAWVMITHINPYWKHFTAVAMIVSAFCASGLFLYLMITNFNSLPALIPVIYNQSIKGWSYINKDDLMIIPLAHFILTIIFLRLNLDIFKFDRRLVFVLNTSLTLFNIIYLIEIFQIFTMLLIY